MVTQKRIDIHDSIVGDNKDIRAKSFVFITEKNHIITLRRIRGDCDY